LGEKQTPAFSGRAVVFANATHAITTSTTEFTAVIL